jgi:hypothetical protein
VQKTVRRIFIGNGTQPIAVREDTASWQGVREELAACWQDSQSSA